MTFVRAFTKKHGALSATALLASMLAAPSALADVTPEHNVGGCGGSCGGSCGLGCGGPAGTRMPTPEQLRQIAADAGIDPAQRITDTTFAQALAVLGAIPQQRLKSVDVNMFNDYAVAQAQRFAAAGYVPYADPDRDLREMDEIVTPLTTIAAGATVDIDLNPVQGWFDLFYIDLSLSTAAGAVVPPEAITASAGQVVGCPLPDCDTGNRRAGRFLQAIPGCCCGRPRRAIVQPVQNNAPYRTSVTNITAAAIQVQIMARGFCQSTRICL